MRIALMQLALCEAVVALAFAVEWVRDRRRPPGRRRFGCPYKLYVVLPVRFDRRVISPILAGHCR
jgi:hypothetical protein